jgi:hypothetical protein
MLTPLPFTREVDKQTEKAEDVPPLLLHLKVRMEETIALLLGLTKDGGGGMASVVVLTVTSEVMGVVMVDKGVSREVYGCDDRELEPSSELDITGTSRVSFED